MENHWYNVGELSAGARSAVEGLMGRALRDDERVYIVAVAAGTDPSTDQRRRAWEELQEMLAETQGHARQSGVAAEEMERAIEEACRDVRYGGEPCG